MRENRVERIESDMTSGEERGLKKVTKEMGEVV